MNKETTFSKIAVASLVTVFSITVASAVLDTTPSYAGSGKDSATGYVKQAARKYRVPARLALAVCTVESNCNCGIRRGKAGEIGPMQVMPRTAKSIGMSLKGCKNQVYAGVKYLKMTDGKVWKYNQGIYAKRRSKAGAHYERMVKGNM
jgi:soluble lytic murein transglycosylase-like protein